MQKNGWLATELTDILLYFMGTVLIQWDYLFYIWKMFEKSDIKTITAINFILHICPYEKDPVS